MTTPRRFLLRMALFLAAVAAVVVALASGLEATFRHNPALNSLILGILAIGIGLNFRQVWLLRAEVDWIAGLRNNLPMLTPAPAPRLLTPLAAMLGERRDRLALNPTVTRSLLDGIASRLEEQRELARYFVGLLIFLGLLGTFWGLSQTVGSIGSLIANLNIGADDATAAFEGLKQGLGQPLSGMGTAFSSSLFGLSGSLVLGFLDLQAGQAQNAFFNDLEEWLATQTKLGGGALAEMGDQPVPAYIQALLEQTADGLDSLRRTLERSEEGRIAGNANLRTLADKLSTLTDQMRAEQALMVRLAENQLEMKPLMARLVEASGASAIDDASRLHLRNIDATLGQVAAEMGTGRDALLRELRGEIKLLARTIAAVAEDAPARVTPQLPA